jgi:hypothetical protein
MRDPHRQRLEPGAGARCAGNGCARQDRHLRRERRVRLAGAHLVFIEIICIGRDAGKSALPRIGSHDPNDPSRCGTVYRLAKRREPCGNEANNADHSKRGHAQGYANLDQASPNISPFFGSRVLRCGLSVVG